MHLLKNILALALVALAFAVPAQAAERQITVTSRGVSTGLHATDVEPLVKGVVATSAQVLTYVGCFLALDDDDVCVRIADRARATLSE